jgi:glutathione S-transferase
MVGAAEFAMRPFCAAAGARATGCSGPGSDDTVNETRGGPMSAAIVVHGFETSNNRKVRIALGYKGIEYEFRTIDPGERDEIVRISGQYLTPVMTHGHRVLFDSAAILRYLDANFPDTPKLFGRDRDEQWEIEDLELFARTELAGPMMEVVHRKVSGGTVDDAMQARCAAAFSKAVAELAARLDGREWLVGDRMSAADITAAAVVARIRQSGALPLPPAAESLFPWIERVTAFE